MGGTERGGLGKIWTRPCLTRSVPDTERAAACGRVWENRETMVAETRLGP